MFRPTEGRSLSPRGSPRPIGQSWTRLIRQRESDPMFRFPWQRAKQLTLNTPGAGPRAARRLCLESLEDRSLPTVFDPVAVPLVTLTETSSAAPVVATFASTDPLGGLTA